MQSFTALKSSLDKRTGLAELNAKNRKKTNIIKDERKNSIKNNLALNKIVCLRKQKARQRHQEPKNPNNGHHPGWAFAKSKSLFNSMKRLFDF